MLLNYQSKFFVQFLIGKVKLSLIDLTIIIFSGDATGTTDVKYAWNSPKYHHFCVIKAEQLLQHFVVNANIDC